MSLHTPRNNDRDQKSFTHNWQENYYEIQAWLQKNYQAMLDLLKEIKRGHPPFTEQIDHGDTDSYIPGPKGDKGERGVPGSVIFVEPDPGEDAFITSGGSSSSGGGGGTSSISIGAPGQDGIDGEDAVPIPGARGADGATGAASTVPGPAIYLEPNDPEEPLLMAGARGADGVTGAAGPAGAIVYLDAEEPELPIMIPGPQGTDGISAGAFGGLWKASTTTAPPPANGYVRWNNATQNTATHLYVNYLTDGGIDLSHIFLSKITAGKTIFIQDKDDATKFQEWYVTAATDGGTYWDYTVTIINSGGGNMANNEKIILGSNAAAGVGAPGSTIYLEPEEPEMPFIIQGPTGAAGSGGSATTFEQNLGSVAVWQGSFTRIDAAIGAASKVLIWQASGPYTGKGTRADEASMDQFTLDVEPAAGSMLVRWRSVQGFAPVYKGPTPMNKFISVAAAMEQMYNEPRGGMQVIGKVKGNIKFSYVVFA